MVGVKVIGCSGQTAALVSGGAARDRRSRNQVVVFVFIHELIQHRQIIDLQLEEPGVTRDLIFLFCGPLTLLFFFNGVIFVSNAVCNNLGRPFWSTLVNWGRHTVGTIPFILGLGQLYGAPGVLVGQALGGVIFGGIAWWLALRVIANSAVGRRPALAAQPLAPVPDG